MVVPHPRVSGRRSSRDRFAHGLGRSADHVPAEAGRAGRTGQALKQVPAEASDKAGRARSNPAFGRLARAGIGARGVIYVLFAFMTADIAVTHHSPSNPSGTGALTEVAKQPAGRPLIALMAVGLLGYAAWRVAQALSGGGTSGTAGGGTDRGKSAHSMVERAGWAAIAGLYLVLCWRAVSLAVNPGAGAGSGGGVSQHPQPLVAAVLRWPGGPGWVGLAGAALAIGAVALVVWGFAHDYSKVLDVQRLRGFAFQFARVSGMMGDASRAVLVGLVSVYLLDAAVENDPSQALSLGGALHSFDRLTAGPVVLLLVTAGLICFAVYSFFEALYRRL